MNSYYQYTGNPIKPKFVLNLGDKTLEDGIDYTVTFADNVNVGTAKVEIVGKGKFTGTVNRTFEIRPVPAKQLKFYVDTTTFEYDGQPQTLNLSIKFGNNVLSENKDYTVDYSDNINVGKAVARVSFKGNYTGNVDIPFIINGFVNTSEISENKIYFGKNITIKAAAQGGKSPYKYAYFCKRADSKQWNRLADFSEEDTFVFTPNHINNYTICVKVSDSEGKISKKYMKLSVVSKLECRCSLSKDTANISDSITISIDMLNGTAPFEYSYLIKNDDETKWTLLKKGTDISSIIHKPRKSGVYDICVKVTDSEQYKTKEYLKLTVY